MTNLIVFYCHSQNVTCKVLSYRNMAQCDTYMAESMIFFPACHTVKTVPSSSSSASKTSSSAKKTYPERYLRRGRGFWCGMVQICFFAMICFRESLRSSFSGFPTSLKHCAKTICKIVNCVTFCSYVRCIGSSFTKSQHSEKNYQNGEKHEKYYLNFRSFNEKITKNCKV